MTGEQNRKAARHNSMPLIAPLRGNVDAGGAVGRDALFAFLEAGDVPELTPHLLDHGVRAVAHGTEEHRREEEWHHRADQHPGENQRIADANRGNVWRQA